MRTMKPLPQRLVKTLITLADGDFLRKAGHAVLFTLLTRVLKLIALDYALFLSSTAARNRCSFTESISIANSVNIARTDPAISILTGA